ncbi:MAG: ABC transporter ATP-binding protein [Nitrospirae bacterium]|nr:ABC transporter ATP-binding protein [Nitrospirota bacterium]
MNAPAIELNAVSKQYRLGENGYRSLREDIAELFRRRRHEPRLFWALRDVSFAVDRGEAVGIIGPNGAGKSTILKLLSRVTKATSGAVKIEGSVGSLLELSAGFHPELTGRENIYLYGSILGMKKSLIDKKYAEIVEFSGLDQFIDTPVKRYSSGMYARLGFSVSAHLDPDVLLVDEVLSVGDYAFQDKCIQKMKAYRASGKTVIYVSHNLDSVRSLCGRAILLKEGRVGYDGEVEKAICEYYMHSSQGQRARQDQKGAFEILDRKLIDSRGRACVIADSGERVRFELTMKTQEEINEAYYAVFIRRSDGFVVFDTSSDLLNGIRYGHGRAEKLSLKYELSINLLKGTYTLGCNIFGSLRDGPVECLFYEDNIFAFTVKDNISHQGIVNMNAKCSVDAF